MKKSTKQICVYAVIAFAIIMAIYTVSKSNFTGIIAKLRSYKVLLSVNSIEDGIPAEIAGQLIKKTVFWLSYNEEFEQAEWTAYILTRNMVIDGIFPRSDNFRSDTNVTTESASLKDYRGSGFDRGHLVPAGDMKWSEISMSESFLMSNISPQIQGFNRGIWKRLEEQVRKWAIKNDSIFIITGPVLRNIQEIIGENKVGVPEYFFKIIVDISYPSYKGIGFIIENKPSNNDIFNYAVNIDSLEQLLNYDFFPGQISEYIEYIESTLDIRDWK